MFDVYKDDIVLTRNASEALFLQAMGVELKTGDEVLVHLKSTQQDQGLGCIARIKTILLSRMFLYQAH